MVCVFILDGLEFFCFSYVVSCGVCRLDVGGLWWVMKRMNFRICGICGDYVLVEWKCLLVFIMVSKLLLFMI